MKKNTSNDLTSFFHFLLMFSNKNGCAGIKKLIKTLMEFFLKFLILTKNLVDFDVTCSVILDTVHFLIFLKNVCDRNGKQCPKIWVLWIFFVNHHQDLKTPKSSQIYQSLQNSFINLPCHTVILLFEVLWKCHSVILSKICLRLHPSTSG